MPLAAPGDRTEDSALQEETTQVQSSSEYKRVRIRVKRVGPRTTHVSVPTFAAGHILVPVHTHGVMAATGLDQEQLVGAALSALVNVTATSETTVDPHSWRARTREELEPAGPDPLPPSAWPWWE